MPSVRCTNCDNETQYVSEMPHFCAYCARPLDPCAPALNQDAQDKLLNALKLARETDDTQRRYQILVAAKAELGEVFEIERELLFLGRLHERGGKPDFYRIPFWPLNALERPDEFSQRARREMLNTFLDNPNISRVAALSPRPETFRYEYFVHMAREYVILFIMGNQTSSHILGFKRRERDVAKRRAQAMANMLHTLNASNMVNAEDKRMLTRALWTAYAELLEQEGGAELLKQYASIYQPPDAPKDDELV